MKKIAILVLIFSFSIASAQKNVIWFSISPYIGSGTSFFIHNESLNDNNVSFKFYSPSHTGSILFSLSYNQNIGISIGSTYHYDTQRLKIFNTKNLKYIHEWIIFENYGFKATFDLQTNTGLFINTGVYMTHRLLTMLYSPTGDFQTVDISSQFPRWYPSLTIRTGIKPYMSQILDIDLGIQFNYSLKPLINDNFYLTSNYFIHRIAQYHDPTLNILNTYLFIGIRYYIGYYGKSSCGKSVFIWNKSSIKSRFK